MILEYEDETGPLHWSTERFDRVIALREEALQAARLAWADYLFVSLKPFIVECSIEQRKEIKVKSLLIIWCIFTLTYYSIWSTGKYLTLV